MNSIMKTIEPKSDQKNFDDFTDGKPLTIKVTKVDVGTGDQPVTIHYENDQGKPYKPGKSMRRVLVHCWGSDANKYVGRSMTLYGDPNVVFGGVKVGGIRISHLSDIDGEMTMALTASRASRKPYTVRPLVAAKTTPSKTVDPTTAELTKDATALAKDMEMIETREEMDAITKRCETIAPKLIEAGLHKWNDKLLALLEEQKSRFAVNPAMMG
jgi:hypothetical protein